jgi:DNA-binding transcriptional LysR family regulator
MRMEPLGEVTFVFVVAPHHPLAQVAHPITAAEIQVHRVVAVADSTVRGNGLTFGLLPGQDVLTVPTMQHKLEAQLRGMGCGSCPCPWSTPMSGRPAGGQSHGPATPDLPTRLRLAHTPALRQRGGRRPGLGDGRWSGGWAN